MQAITSIYCIGDTMLELISNELVDAQYQRTLVLGSEDTAVGGAVCNLYWYFSQLERPSAIATHYGRPDRARVAGLLAGAQGNSHFLAEKQSPTDLLVVLRRISMPAIYVAGSLNKHDIAVMLAGLKDEGVIVFGGSRHGALRRAFLTEVSSYRQATTIFSPSYTIYEYSIEELRQFLAISHITFVNEQQAEYLRQVFSVDSVSDVMKSGKMGGVVTYSSRGAVLYPRHVAPLQVPSISGRSEDVIGAGEAFLCGFLHGFLANESWQSAGEMGAAVAAQVVWDKRVRAPINRGLLPPLREIA